jgi:hypothetical protein
VLALIARILKEGFEDDSEDDEDEESDQDTGSDEEPASRSHRKSTRESRPKLAKKTVPEMAKDEKFFTFYRNFKLQVQSWNIPEDSSLFREYFEMAIQKNALAKSEYWSIRSRHPKWKMLDISAWMVKRIDNVNPEEIKKSYDRLCQGAQESITSFLERYQESAYAYSMFFELSESESLKNFIDKLRIGTQRHVNLNKKMGLKLKSIEEVFEMVEIFELSLGLKQKGSRANIAEDKYKDNTRRKKLSSKPKNFAKKPFEKSKSGEKSSYPPSQKQYACYICQSKDHVLKNCPYNTFQKSEERKTNATLSKDLPVWNTSVCRKD